MVIEQLIVPKFTRQNVDFYASKDKCKSFYITSFGKKQVYDETKQNLWIVSKTKLIFCGSTIIICNN